MKKFLALIVASFIAVLFWAFLLVIPTMLAWNCFVPHVSNLPELNFWQTFSFIFLILTFFKPTEFKKK